MLQADQWMWYCSPRTLKQKEKL